MKRISKKKTLEESLEITDQICALNKAKYDHEHIRNLDFYTCYFWSYNLGHSKLDSFYYYIVWEIKREANDMRSPTAHMLICAPFAKTISFIKEKIEHIERLKAQNCRYLAISFKNICVFCGKEFATYDRLKEVCSYACESKIVGKRQTVLQKDN